MFIIFYSSFRRRKLKAHTSADHEYVNTTQNTVATENIEINSAFPTVHNDANIRMKDVEVAYDTVADATYNTVDDTTDEMKSAKLSSIKYENIADDGGKYKTIDAVADKARKADNIRNMTSDVLVDTAYETLERTEDKTSDYTDLRY